MKKKTHTRKKKDFYTTYEAGNLLFVSHSTIIDWINSGKLKATKTLGGHRRIPRSALDGFVKQNNMGTNDRHAHRILIVDDDETIRAGLKETLESHGFAVDAAADGFEAGVLAIHREPDLIILDLKMQGLDGFSACRLIKTNPLLQNIKILVLTGYPSRDNIAAMEKLGADSCLAKPAETSALLREINALLGAPRPRRTVAQKR